MKPSSTADQSKLPEMSLLGNAVFLYPAFTKAVNRLRECFDYASNGNPLCTACFGPSGSGKTQLALYFASKHPHHDGADGRIMPVVYVRLLPGLSIKQAAEQILNAINDPLYLRGNAFQKTERIKYFFTKCQVRMLILDETNHFVDNRMGIAHDAADWLKHLIDTTKVSVVLLGIEKSFEVLRQDIQLRRRFSAPFTLGRFTWTEDNEGKEYLELLLQFSQAEMKVHMDLHILRDPDLAYRLFCASSGSIGYTAKFIEAAIVTARRERRGDLDLTHFLKGFEEVHVQEEAPTANPFDPDIEPEPLNLPIACQPRGGRSKRRGR